jgi:hypothetical protein
MSDPRYTKILRQVEDDVQTEFNLGKNILEQQINIKDMLNKR